jgi:peptide/nickel transport system permease protein
MSPDRPSTGTGAPLAVRPAGRARLLALGGRGHSGLLERVSFALVVVVTLLLPFAGLLAPHGERDIAGTPFSSPGSGHLLGTDSQGRDVFSRVLVGLEASWFGALGVIAFGLVVGSLVGIVAGMSGGIVDIVLMRLTDAALALPGTLVALLVVAALGPSFQHILIAVAVTWWPWYARIVRGQTRAIVTLPHVDAARSSGVPRRRVAAVHVLPGIVGSIVVAASLDVGGVLLALAGLSFIGLGAPPPAAEIGGMSAEGLTYLFNAPWIAIAPAAALFVVALLANFAGDHVRELVD